jgi:hypothetical protein
MTRVLVRAYRAAMHLLPTWFRASYGEEMSAAFAARLEETGTIRKPAMAASELADLVATSARLRLQGSGAAQLPFGAAAAVAALLAVVILANPYAGRVPGENAANTVNFQATDPAGEFTLSIRDGKPVAVTLDEMRVPGERIVTNGDSIHVLSPRGRVVLAVAYYAQGQRIEWDPRDPSCRGQTLTCGR